MGKIGSEPAKILTDDFKSGVTTSDSGEMKPKRKEDSVVTSLIELRHIEKARLRQEEEEDRKRQEEAKRLKEDSERRFQEEENHKRQEAEARRKQETEEQARRKREDEIKFRVDLEKVRIVAATELEKERLRIEAENGPKGFSKTYVVPGFFVLLCTTGFFGFMFYQKSRELESTRVDLGQKVSDLNHNLARVTTERDAEKSRAELALQQLGGYSGQVAKLNEQVRGMQAQLNAVSKPELRRVRRVVQKNDAKQEAVPAWKQQGNINRGGNTSDDPLSGIKQ